MPQLFFDGTDTPYELSPEWPNMTEPAFYCIVVADPEWNGGDLAAVREYAKVRFSKEELRCFIHARVLLFAFWPFE